MKFNNILLIYSHTQRILRREKALIKSNIFQSLHLRQHPQKIMWYTSGLSLVGIVVSKLHAYYLLGGLTGTGFKSCWVKFWWQCQSDIWLCSVSSQESLTGLPGIKLTDATYHSLGMQQMSMEVSSWLWNGSDCLISPVSLASIERVTTW